MNTTLHIIDIYVPNLNLHMSILIYNIHSCMLPRKITKKKLDGVNTPDIRCPRREETEDYLHRRTR